MALFAIVAYVLFHFALHRNTLDGRPRRRACCG